MPDIPFRSRASFKAGANLAANQGITFAGGSPSSTSLALYASGVDLYWNGYPLATSGGYVHLTTDEIVTGVKTFGDGSTSTITEWNKSATGQAILAFQTAGLDRQDILVQDSELGSDSGSNMYFATFTDAGALIDYPLKWVRAANGAITIGASTRPTYFTGGYVGFGTSSPTSNHHHAKSLSNTVTTTTANLTLTDQHNVVYCNSATGITITLPNATTCAHREYVIIQGNSGPVIIYDPTLGSNLQTLYVVNSSVTIISNGTTWLYKNAFNPTSNSSSTASLATYITTIYDDFININFNNNTNGSTWFTFHSSGGGASVTDAGAYDTSHPGCISLNAAGSGGEASIWTGGQSVLLGNGTVVIETDVFVGALSTGGNTYSIVAGLIDSTTAIQQVDGVYFQYLSSSSTSWRFGCISNSTATYGTSTVTVAANTWYKLKIEIFDSPAKVNFYINNTLVGNVITNIPVGAGRQTSYGVQMRKTNGNGAVNCLVDYFYAMQSLRNAR